MGGLDPRNLAVHSHSQARTDFRVLQSTCLLVEHSKLPFHMLLLLHSVGIQTN